MPAPPPPLPPGDKPAAASGAWSAAAVAEGLGRLFNTYNDAQARNNNLSHPGQHTMYDQPPNPFVSSETVQVHAFGVNWAIIAAIAAVAIVVGVVLWRR